MTRKFFLIISFIFYTFTALADDLDVSTRRWTRFKQDLTKYLDEMKPLELYVPENASPEEKDIHIWCHEKRVRRHKELQDAIADADQKFNEFCASLTNLIATKGIGTYRSYLFEKTHDDICLWYTDYVSKNLLNIHD